MPSITVPTITLEGDTDGVTPLGGRQADLKRFRGTPWMERDNYSVRSLTTILAGGEESKAA